MNTLSQLAFKFETFLKTAQQTSVQAGEIADAFPQFFPNKNQSNSPLMNKLDIFLSSTMPSDMNAKIGFLVQPGFKPNFTVLFTQNGKLVDNAKISTAIMKFLFNEMKSFTQDAMKKFAGRSVIEVLNIATHTL